MRPTRRSEDPNLLLGVAASPGLGVGRVLRVHHEDIEVKEYAADRHKERRLLNEALDRAMVQLEALENRLRQDADPDKAVIFAAHREILRDPDLLDIASSAIDKGKSAAFAWRRAYTTYADRLAGLTNELLAQRATDVRDVGQRVLEEVTGQRREKADIPEGTILIAEDLTPSDTASLDRTKVVGFCTQAGGASSHVSILARSLDIPAVAGIEPRALDIADGTLVILDGAKGTLADERHRGRRRADPAAPGAARRNGGPRSSPTRTSRPSPATGTTSRWSPTSAASTTPGRRRPRAPRASGCCARSSSSSAATQGADRGRAGRDLHGDRRGRSAPVSRS